MNNVQELVMSEIDKQVKQLKQDYKEKGYNMTIMNELMLKRGIGYGIPLAAKILASIDFNPLDTNELPSKEEYESKFSKPANPSYSEPKFKCPKCDGGMCKDLSIVLTTYPVKYCYKCDKCGHIEYLHV